MRITRLQVHKVNLPLTAGYRWAPGVYWGATKGLVAVETDAGLTGWGEVATPELADLLLAELVRPLIGADPFDLEDCSRRCLPEIRTLKNTHDDSLVRAFGGIEMALWDLKGQALGLPIYQLLGGAARTHLGVSEYFALRVPGPTEAGKGDPGPAATPLEVARYCARMRELHGSTLFEGKLGVLDLDTEVQMVKEIRAAIGPDATLRLDANMAWPLNTARRALALLAPYNIANIEDPVASWFDMAKLRQHSAIPFSSHVPDLRLAVELGVPDTLVLNVTRLGGLRETIKFIGACETMGVGFWFYSGETAIGTAAYMQLAAALPYLDQPGQSLLRWYADDVVTPLFAPDHNQLPIPTGPGLGVTVDPVALERCRQRYAREGTLPQLGEPGVTHYRRFSAQ
jgi:glucarate dehydratase